MKIQSLVFLASLGLVLSACPPSEEGSDASVVDAGGTVHDAATGDSATADGALTDSGGELDSSVSPPSCDNDDSYEDNDTAETAKAITVPGTIDNLVGCDEYDWYKFTVPANNGVMIEIAFAHADSDLDLAIYEASEPESSVDISLTSSDDEDVSVELFEQATEVLVRVRNYDYPDTQANYSMTVTFYDGGYCENDSYEVNDSAATAVSMTSNHLSGKLCNGDLDYFSFTLNGAGEGANVTVSRGDAPLDISLTEEGSTTAIGTVSHDADNSFDRISFNGALDTTYVLKLSGSGIVNYSVDVKGPPPANDVCADAPVLNPGTSVNGSTVDANNDYEFFGSDPCGGYDMYGADVAYRVAIPANKYLNLSLDAERDLSMYLLEDCTSRCCWAGVDAHTGGRQENLSYHNITGAEQNLFLIVDSFSSYAAADFVLAAELADGAPVEDGGTVADAGTEPSVCHPDEVPDAGVAEDAS